MFFLKVENTRGLVDRDGRPHADNPRVLENSNVRITIQTDALYSFFFSYKSSICLGESLFPQTENTVRTLCERLSNEPGKLILPAEIASLAAVNIENGQTTILKNISCNRPIYFHDREDLFVCGTDPRKFGEYGIKIEFDDAVLPEYLTYRFVMPPRTMFKGINSLPGGWSLSRDLSENDSKLLSRWDPGIPAFQGDLSEAANKVTERLGNGMKQPLLTPENTTLLLSGGLDSSILGSIFEKSGQGRYSTSSGFHGITGDFGERDYALSAAESLGLKHNVFEFDGEMYLDSLVDSIDMAREPIHHLQSAVLYMMFSQGMSEATRYLVCGEGADSLFCNTMHYQYWKFRSILNVIEKPIVRTAASPIFSLLSRFDQRFEYFTMDHSADYSGNDHFIWGLGAYGDSRKVMSCLGIDFDKIIEGRRRMLAFLPGYSVLDHITLLSFLGEADTTMRIWGRLAEQAGMTVIYPFTDPELIRFSFGIPWELKAREPKHILRSAAARLGIPELIIKRPKRSFGFPIEYWASPGALFQPLVDMASETFDKTMLNSMQSPRGSEAMILWSMLSLYIFRKIVEKNTDPDEIKMEIRDRRKSLKGTAR